MSVVAVSVPADLWLISGTGALTPLFGLALAVGIAALGVVAQAGDEIARFLLVAAQPLGEPVARGGPFVMNTREEVLRAFDDYRNNRF